MRSPYECPLSDTGPFPERPAPSGSVPDTNRVKGSLPCPKPHFMRCNDGITYAVSADSLMISANRESNYSQT